jgi:hypothetical protein
VAATKAITALRQHWDEVLGLIGDADRPHLLALAERLTAAEDTDERTDLTLELLGLLRDRLSPDHPVRRAIAAKESRNAETVEAELGAAIGSLDLQLTLQQVRDRLLAVPAYSAEELLALGGDPDAEGLIRLRDGEGNPRLPAFQFDPRGAPLPVVVAVNQLLHAGSDPWGVADWWLGRNARLGGVPSRLLGTAPDDDLVSAARALRWDG